MATTNKKKQKTEVKDVTGGGWSEHHFVYPKASKKITPASFGIYPTAEGIRQNVLQQQQAAQVGQVNAAFGAAASSGTVIPSTAQMPGMNIQQQAQQAQPGQIGNVNYAQTPAAQYLTPEQMQPVKDYLHNPDENAPSSPLDVAKSWVSNLFDTTDTWDYQKGGTWSGGDNVVESAWDGFLGGIGWGYDRLNHATTAALSAMPGGTRTLTWDEASQVSVGQELMANIGTSAGRIKRGEMSPGDIVGLLASGMGAGIGPMALAAQTDPTQAPGFDITNPTDRKRAFEENIGGKLFSGFADANFVLFGDPLIGVGKGLKAVRMTYLDRQILNDADLAMLADEFKVGFAEAQNQVRVGGITMAGGDPSQIKNLSPVVQFAYWVARKNENGEKVTQLSEITKHRVVKWATKREALATALYNVDTPEEAAMVIRSAYGDRAAREALIMSRADLAVELGDRQREFLRQRLALNPQMRERIANDLERKQNAFQDKILNLRKQSRDTTAEQEYYQQRLNEAYDSLLFVRKLDLDKVDPLVTRETRDIARKAVAEMSRRDKYFEKAYLQEAQDVAYYKSLRESNAGFSRNNAFGRFVEGSRERRARAGYEAAATRGARVVKPDGTTRKLRPWESDVFNNNGLVRTLRLWRWAGEETPLGFIFTRGPQSQESMREFEAALNANPIYAGSEKFVTTYKMKPVKGETNKFEYVLDKNGERVQQTHSVGGVKRKEQLLRMYAESVNDTTLGDQAAKVAVDRAEQMMMNDIFAWHGLTPDDATNVLARINQKRAEMMDMIKNDGYWVDDVDGKKVINRSPWLETHLQSGTFMHNFKAIEKAARLYNESGFVRSADNATQFFGDKLGNLYEAFNEVWRPAVLMRLGYTQRNVVEGLYRASAFQFSLDPVGFAAANGFYALRNAYTKLTTTGAIERAVVAERVARETGQAPRYPRKFIKWRERQIAANDENVAQRTQVVHTIASMIINAEDEATGLQIRNMIYNESINARDAAVAARQGGESAVTVARLEEHAQTLRDMLSDLPQVTKGTKATKDQIPHINESMDNFRNLISYMNDSVFRRNMLDNDLQSVALYRQQGLQKFRTFQNPIQVSDANTFRNAFDPESPYTPIALMALSGNNTTMNMASLNINAFSSALKAVEMRTYVAVNPDVKNATEYFNGVAGALRQFGLSDVGNRIMRGDSPDEVYRYLMNDMEGQAIAKVVANAHVEQASVPALVPKDPESTMDYVNYLFERYNTLAPTPEFQQYLKGLATNKNFGAEVPLSGATRGFDGTVVETFLGAKNSAGEFALDLKPVVGNIAMETGDFLKAREMWAKFANFGMKWLGTIPEDLFVRSPFYGKRYRQALQDFYSIEMQQTNRGYLTVREMGAIEEQAHARALKDTKDWLYTIERRTRLGAAGEIGIPFISAFQNSVTTLGRLIWRDPSIIPITAKIWNAPNQMGLEDEEGNIVIPIPHDYLPDGVEQALGIENLTNIKIKKSSLNVIMPESGFGFVPRPGPLVGAPASEIMKHGWFGQSVETPTWLANVFGKETSDTIWGTWKAYLFGEQGGVSKAPLSLDMFEPPVVAKIQQMLEGEGSSSQYAFYYNAQMRTEMAKYLAGERDDIATKEEIKQRTNNFYMLRILGNLTAFTPPAYDTKIDPLVATMRQYDQQYGAQSAEMFNKNFGNLLLMLGDYSTSKNISGMPATTDAVAAARKYTNIIQQVAPDLQQSGDLSTLAMLVTNNPNAYYDNSAYAWQYTTQIPGVTDYFRELQTPEMAWNESRKNAGWTEYISRMGMLDSLLQQRGLTSYRSAQAADLREMKNQTIIEMRDNPLYQPWYQDYIEHGSIRTEQAVKVMQAALSDPQFYKDNIVHEDNKVGIWEAADFYLQQRQRVIEALQQTGQGINNKNNQGIQDYWDGIRTQLVQQVDGWGTFANRYLNGDDDPTNVGVQFGTTYSVDTGATNG